MNGNKIIGNVQDCDIKFLGENSTLKAGENFKADGMQIRIGSNCDIEIGDDVSIYGSTWNFCDNSFCKIGSRSHFRSGGFMNATESSKIIIGGGFTVEHWYIIIALPYTTISFGEDCMVSRRVTVQSNDGHDIFDVNTGENINAAKEISKSRKIMIGNHVWIGQEAMVLYNTEIGDGSIVGAKSLVKNKFPNNCIIGGNPARLLKKDIAWSRGHGGSDIGAIDERYVKTTKEL